MSAKDHPNNAPGVPMVFPLWLERLQVKYINRALKPIARYLPGTATIEHRGRKSGKPYQTIVTAYRKDGVLAIALAHGKTDWVKNVLAAGEATCTSPAALFTSSTPGLCPPAPTVRGCRGWRACSCAGSGSSSAISPEPKAPADVRTVCGPR